MHGARHGWRWFPLLATLALAIIMASCAPNDEPHATAPRSASTINGQLPAIPVIAANGPDLTYAFIYDNQVWAHVQGNTTPRQLTHLTQPTDMTIRWGPLVWSQSGRYLAFAVALGQSPVGALYYLDSSGCLADTTSCQLYRTPGTGSVYGHTYSWYRDDMLVYGSGAGLTLYDVADPNGARTWQARIVYNADPSVDIGDEQCATPRSYGDTQVVGETLYYTCQTLNTLGASTVIGSAQLYQLDLSPIGAIEATYDPTNQSTAFTRDQSLGAIFNQAVIGQALQGNMVASLGSVVVDQQGNPVVGAWVARGTTLAYQILGAVSGADASATVNTRFCLSQASSVVNQTAPTATASPTPSCSSLILTDVGPLSVNAHPQLAIAANGAVALSGGGLVIENSNTVIGSINWPGPAAWAGDTLYFTQLNNRATNASGMTRYLTTVESLQPGQTPTTLIAGASNLAFQGNQ